MRHSTIFSVIFVLFFITFQVCPASADTIRLTADEWCPFNCSPASSSPGYVVEIAKEIFQKAGHKVIYVVKPWDTALEDVKKGKDTGIIAVTPTESNTLIYPSEPVGRPRNTFFVRKDDPWTYSDPQSLDNKRLGVIKYYDYGTDLNNYIYANLGTDAVYIAEGLDPLKDNFKRLVDKKIDVLAEDSSVGAYMASRMNIQNKIKQVDSNMPATPIFIAFSPQNPKAQEYATLFDKGIQELRSSGKLAKILKRYGLSDWK